MSSTRIVKLRNIKRALGLGVPKEEAPPSFVLAGRIAAFRPYKSFNFIDLVDGSSSDHLQVVVARELLKKPELGSYAVLQGRLVPSRGQKQPVEFKVDEVKSVSQCNPEEYPLASTTEYSNNWYRRRPDLRIRSQHFASLLRVRSELELALHLIMKQMDFFRVHTPVLTSNDSEASSDLFLVKRTRALGSGHAGAEAEAGAAEDEDVEEEEEEEAATVDNDETEEINSQARLQSLSPETMQGSRLVRDDYFNKDVFLITSAQLHLESLAASLSRVYTVSSCFRAEGSISSRHLCEFQMLELEEANITDLEPLMDRAEAVVKFIGQYLIEISDHRRDFSWLLERNKNGPIFSRLLESSFVRMPYEEAMRLLASRSDFTGDTRHGADIGRRHEKALLEHTNQVPIFVTHYPASLKPFYMKSSSLDEAQGDSRALCFDLIAPHGGELCGGSLREDSHRKLANNLARMCRQDTQPRHSDDDNEAALANFNWYLDLRRFGSFPHGGFGLGVDRLLQTLLGISNIKDTTAFPRATGFCPM